MKYDFKQVYSYSKDLDLLYVEDDNNLRKETADILEDFFQTTTIAIDGQDGLEKYQHFKDNQNKYYDLIITDINMPNMDGLEMIKNIMQINPDQVIIVVSAYNESQRLIDLIQAGIANFLMKPISTTHLIQMLYRTCKSITNQKQKDAYLIQQSKLAQMGEMIDSIAHQWKQPLGILKLRTQMLEWENNDKPINQDDLKEFIHHYKLQMSHLEDTIDQFRSFFRSDKTVKMTNLNNILNSVALLLKDNLIKNTIELKIQCDKDITISVIENEYKHILINLITNSIDAFNQNDILSHTRFISLNAIQKDNKTYLIVCDNAGGIPNQIINNIFTQNFTTKKSGTGVGLYLTTQILNKIGSTIKVENKNNGACFTIIHKN